MIRVDNGHHPLGRMIMCHLIADSPRELQEVADRLGLRRSYIQYPGTWKEHLDVSRSKRAEAVRLGAREISQKELTLILMARREAEQRGISQPSTHHPQEDPSPGPGDLRLIQ